MKSRLLTLSLYLLLAASVPCYGSDNNREARQQMVETQIRARGVTNPKVLSAMNKVERHRFVHPNMVPDAYIDSPLPIGHGQTISQPYIVAYMTELLDPRPGDVVLEVGTGSGYQAAVLAEIVKHVYTIELIKPLAQDARKRLASLGYKNITVRTGDGYQGWPEKAPFDAIMVTAAADHIPPPLVEQLKPGRRLVIPVGSTPLTQELIIVEKKKDGSTIQRSVLPVRFVPLRRKN
ncbi:MAG: protein-L-isoaspartate(D-aspartate) O-methyltransferase [Elusimicrobia bacterium]|nr:protein-L-isoaspartate(D-aspartate) O-methyltransferase [Candidatus Obscuribacterium magneticum]